jgi:general secretion pathway protein L
MLERADNAPSVSAPLSRFVRWWLDRLARDLGAVGRRFGQRTLILFVRNGRLDVRLEKRARLRPVGELALVNGYEPDSTELAALKRRLSSFRSRRAETVLRLGDDQVLSNDLLLPRAAHDVLRPVVRNQLQRLVPWDAGQMHFGYEVVSDEGDARHLKVHAVVTGPVQVAGALELARNLGCRPSAIEYAPDFEAPAINLLTLEVERHAGLARRCGWLIAFLFFASLAGGALGLHRYDAAATSVTTVEQSIKQARNALVALNDRIDRTGREQRRDVAIIAEKAQVPIVVGLIEAVSRIFPDTAWLTSLEVSGVDVVLSGKARDASALIGLLENSPYFTSARFASRTNLDPKTGLETFSIRSVAAERAVYGER